MWFKADMHIHSIHSDGRNSPREIINYALYRDLKIISITDHDTFQGSIVARTEAKALSNEILVVTGIELRSDRGDILLYCYEPIDTPREISLLIDYAHENNCIVVPAHPFDLFRYGIGDAIRYYNGWDGIEVWNASANKNANKKAIRLANELGLPGLANSDAHIVEYIGVAYTLIEMDELNIENLFKSIRNKRVKPHYGYPSLNFFLKNIKWSLIRRITKLRI
ncbi:MAG: PHP domain-containing protein [Desulfurococcaceae archaeon]